MQADRQAGRQTDRRTPIIHINLEHVPLGFHERYSHNKKVVYSSLPNCRVEVDIQCLEKISAITFY